MKNTIVAIIGCGVIGLSAAKALASEGVEVVQVEATKQFVVDDMFKATADSFGVLFNNYPKQVTPFQFDLKVSCGVNNWYDAYYHLDYVFEGREKSWYVSSEDGQGSWMEINMEEQGKYRLDCHPFEKKLTFRHIPM